MKSVWEANTSLKSLRLVTSIKYLIYLFFFFYFFQDNIGVFVDQNGKLIQDGRIIWSDTPASVVIHKPYAVARLPRHVEASSFLLYIQR
jgi:hypothetical protein